VIASVKRLSQTDFPVRMGARRAGDPAALVAQSKRIGEVFGWRPELNRLDTIVGHALAWERQLIEWRAAS
jgi:UDP-glucose 4-epimerase